MEIVKIIIIFYFIVGVIVWSLSTVKHLSKYDVHEWPLSLVIISCAWPLVLYWIFDVNSVIFFRKKRVELGEGFIIQYTIFEHKKFGGIWIYNWKTIMQNRFHTHAFASYAFLLNGQYTEEVIMNGKTEEKVVNQWMKPRQLPKNYCHRILKANPNTWTIVFFGKWTSFWWEYFQDTKTWVKYSWGRKVVEKISNQDILKVPE